MLTGLEAFKNFAPVLLRVVTGVIFVVHGYGKLFGGMEQFTGYVTQSLHLPAFLAWGAAGIEFFGGTALVLGLLTRLSALGIAAVMAVAVSKVHWAAGLTADGGYEYPLVLLCVAVSLMLTGGGPLSFDRLFIEKKSS